MKKTNFLASILAVSFISGYAYAERADWSRVYRDRGSFTFSNPTVSPNSNNNYDMPLQANSQTINAYCEMAVRQASRGRQYSDNGWATRTTTIRGRVTYYSAYGRKPWDDKSHNSVSIATEIQCDLDRPRRRRR